MTLIVGERMGFGIVRSWLKFSREKQMLTTVDRLKLIDCVNYLLSLSMLVLGDRSDLQRPIVIIVHVLTDTVPFATFFNRPDVFLHLLNFVVEFILFLHEHFYLLLIPFNLLSLDLYHKFSIFHKFIFVCELLVQFSTFLLQFIDLDNQM
jgi:hypothetical protein